MNIILKLWNSTLSVEDSDKFPHFWIIYQYQQYHIDCHVIDQFMSYFVDMYICRKLSDEVTAWLYDWTKVQMIAHGLADATATQPHRVIYISLKSRMVDLSGACLSRSSWKRSC